jgi:hypothetical protein
MMIDAATLDIVLKIGQLIGIPVAIGLYVMNNWKERRDREYGTYHALDDKYIDYLKLCLQHPDLDVADLPQKTKSTQGPDRKHRELLMFSILISIMERAYLMYQDKSGKVRKAQWAGWDSYIKGWCTRENFREVGWGLAQEFDTGFVDYLNKIINP